MRPTEVGGVYVHAPFCARRCVYCDFAVKVRAEGGPESWWEAIAAELEHVRRAGRFVLAPELRSVYVGGGTPSLLGPRAMSGLADILGRNRLGHADLEWTAEANPESFDTDVAQGWRAAGVDRLSLGVQTFHEPALRWMGRLHGPEGGARALEAARAAGIENVSVDLIFGLPAHLERSWREDLARTVDLGAPHVSLYGLTVEPETVLGRAVAEGREPPVDDDRYADEFLEAAEVLKRAGYHHYEVSNFAWPGYQAQHNAIYWSGAPYLGLGNGAHSYAPPVRLWNVRDWDEYRQTVRGPTAPEAGHEVLDASALELERIWLGLRTSEGIVAPAPGTRRAHLVDDWVRRGLASTERGRVRLSTRGWLLLDRLAVEYMG